MHVFLQIMKLVFGVWLALSPWVFGYAESAAGTISNVVVGGIFVLMGALNLARVARKRPLVGSRDDKSPQPPGGQ